jgi:hypothetical protein
MPIQRSVNWYTAPLFLFFNGAPITAVVPEIVTDMPNQSPVSQPGLTTSARSDHTIPDRVNSNAVPQLR